MPETPNDLDVVQVVKQEWPDLGGEPGPLIPYALPIEPLEDGIEIAALFIVEVGRRNKGLAIWSDDGDMRFRDVVNPGTDGKGYTLSELLAGSGGLTEEGHKVLRQLIHWIPDGPGDGFSTSPFKEETWSGAFKTYEVWWESNSKLKKIFDHSMTWTGVKKTSETWTLYKTDGTSKLIDATDTITYSGIFPQTRTRVFTVYP